jgi:phage terminase small subunit
MVHLTNTRHELFCQELAKGLTQEAAYVAAGYSGNRGGASRLAANVNILARVAELKAKSAEDTGVTIASLVDELDAAKHMALKANPVQASAAVVAIMAKAKLLGLSNGNQAAKHYEPIKVTYVMPALHPDDANL